MRLEQHNNDSLMTPTDRKQSIHKKRMIRKDKLGNHSKSNSQYEDVKNVDTSKLTRQQRAKVQKVKNRQAAQRSRDVHREYVTNLEKQVCQLRSFRDSIHSRTLCARCQKQISQNQMESNESQHQESKTKSEIKEIPLYERPQFQQIQPQSSAFYNHMNYFGQQQESFLRLDSNNNSSYMSSIFFVSMILIGALIYGTYVHKQSASMSRALMQIPQLQQLPQIKEQAKEHIQQLQQKGNANQTALAPIAINSGLVKFNDQDCLKSLMNRSGLATEDKKSLRSYSDQSRPQNLMQNHEGILLCTVRMPKNADNKLSNIRSSLVKLYLLGSQIKQMITASNLLIPFKNKNIQINGLYKISAEIKDVDLVSDHNCLL